MKLSYSLLMSSLAMAANAEALAPGSVQREPAAEDHPIGHARGDRHRRRQRRLKSSKKDKSGATPAPTFSPTPEPTAKPTTEPTTAPVEPTTAPVEPTTEPTTVSPTTFFPTVSSAPTPERRADLVPLPTASPYSVWKQNAHLELAALKAEDEQNAHAELTRAETGLKAEDVATEDSMNGWTVVESGTIVKLQPFVPVASTLNDIQSALQKCDSDDETMEKLRKIAEIVAEHLDKDILGTKSGVCETRRVDGFEDEEDTIYTCYSLVDYDQFCATRRRAQESGSMLVNIDRCLDGHMADCKRQGQVSMTPPDGGSTFIEQSGYCMMPTTFRRKLEPEVLFRESTATGVFRVHYGCEEDSMCDVEEGTFKKDFGTSTLVDEFWKLLTACPDTDKEK